MNIDIFENKGSALETQKLTSKQSAQNPIKEPGADPIGSTPGSGTIQGAMKTTMKKQGGCKPEILVNKLGERLAFENRGVRLYNHLLLKCQAPVGHAKFDGLSAPLISIEKLSHFRDEESEHFHIVEQALVHLGVDLSAEPPDVDIIGVSSQGLQKVLTDPRSTIAQCLEAILAAELIDKAGWELLVELCTDMKLDTLVGPFTKALNEEQHHLFQINEWHTQLVLIEAGVT